MPEFEQRPRNIAHQHLARCDIVGIDDHAGPSTRKVQHSCDEVLESFIVVDRSLSKTRNVGDGVTALVHVWSFHFDNDLTGTRSLLSAAIAVRDVDGLRALALQ